MARIATEYGCHYFDANTVISTSPLDGVHLDTDQHKILGQALAGMVTKIIGPE